MLFFVASRSLFTPVTSPFSLFTSSVLALVASSAFTEVAKPVTFWSTAAVAFLFCLRAAISSTLRHVQLVRNDLQVALQCLIDFIFFRQPLGSAHRWLASPRPASSARCCSRD